MTRLHAAIALVVICVVAVGVSFSRDWPFGIAFGAALAVAFTATVIDELERIGRIPARRP